MKSFVTACAVLTLFAATASAADLAVSKSTLGNMGLGSMQTLSDEAGSAVRGKGTFAGVWGGSQANWVVGHGPGAQLQTSTNSYEAGAQWIGKGSSAGGNSLSFAGNVQVQLAVEGAFPPTYIAGQLSVLVAGGVSGGSASAWAN